MPNKLFKKGLIVGIIVLFIGAGIQPAISNEVTISQTSDIEKDCDCQSNGKTHLAEKILNKLEKNEILSNVDDDTIKPQDIGLVCFILENLINKYIELRDYYGRLYEENIYTHPILATTYRNIANIYALLAVDLMLVYYALKC